MLYLVVHSVMVLSNKLESTKLDEENRGIKGSFLDKWELLPVKAHHYSGLQVQGC